MVASLWSMKLFYELPRKSGCKNKLLASCWQIASVSTTTTRNVFLWNYFSADCTRLIKLVFFCRKSSIKWNYHNLSQWQTQDNAHLCVPYATHPHKCARICLPVYHPLFYTCNPIVFLYFSCSSVFTILWLKEALNLWSFAASLLVFILNLHATSSSSRSIVLCIY